MAFMQRVERAGKDQARCMVFADVHQLAEGRGNSILDNREGLCERRVVAEIRDILSLATRISPSGRIVLNVSQITS